MRGYSRPHPCVHDTDDLAVQGIIGVSGALDECLAEKQGEFVVTVVRQACS